MALEQLSIRLRPRSGWEALDLGFRLATTNAAVTWGSWLAAFLPAVLLLLVLCRSQPWLAALLIWWLKPLFGRYVLWTLARRVFGEPASPLAALAATRELLLPALVGDLLWRRVLPTRSFALPVALLERQRGAPARARRRLLGRRAAGHAFWLAFVCLHFELAALFGLHVLIRELLWPGADPPLADDEAPVAALGDIGQLWSVGDTLLYAAAVTLIEPLFVAGGFALYLNRRIVLEGWDVEMALRRLAARLAPAAGAVALLVALMLPQPAPAACAATAGTVTVSALAVSATGEARCPARRPGSVDPAMTAATAPDGGVAAPGDGDGRRNASDDAAMTAAEAADDGAQGTADQPARDAPALSRPPLDGEARRAVRAVLADPVFGQRVEVPRWRSRFAGDDDAPRPLELGWLERLLRLVADLWQALTWLALAIVVVLLLRAALRRHGRDAASGATGSAPPNELFGLAIAPESLPDDVAAAAAALIDAGRVREALALVYRATLSRLVHGHGIALGAAATEGEVLAAAERVLASAQRAWFGTLLAQWIDAAYARREPDRAAVAATAAAFARHFPPAAAEPAR